MKQIYRFVSATSNWNEFVAIFGGEDNELSLPRRWDGKDYYSDLDGLFFVYLERLNKVYPYSSMAKRIADICSSILDIVRIYSHGDPAEAYYTMRSLMNELIEYPMYVNWRQIGDLYRMTRAESNVNDRTRIIHAPYDVRTKISTCRYSIAGYPCLYLSDSLELAEMEMGLFTSRTKAIAAKFTMDKDVDTKDIIILELGFRPQDLVSNQLKRTDLEKGVKYSINTCYSSLDVSEANEQIGVPQYYMLWYPLLAACSYVRSSRDDPFAPEYVVPQLLTQWLRNKNTGRLVGVRYFSCYSKKASEAGMNYVFPTSGDPIILKDGIKQFCPVLNEAFKITETEYILEYESIKQLAEALEKKKTKKAFNLTRKDYKNEDKVEIPNGEMYIAARSFKDCKHLEKIILPNSVIEIGDRAFHGCEALETIHTNASEHGAYFHRLEEIGDNAFSGCISLKSVRFPNTMRQIGNWTFYGCRQLETINIPASVIHIGKGLLSGCNRIKNVALDVSNEKYCHIGHYIIEKNEKTIVVGYGGGTIVTPDNICKIGEGAFSKNTNIESVQTSAKTIGKWAFEGCSNMTTLSLGTGVEEIKEWAFQDCKNLIEFSFPATLTRIGEEAFRGCTSLKRVSFPHHLEYIGEGAFYACTSLEAICYDGTFEEWNTIEKGSEWDLNVGAHQIICRRTDNPTIG